ncbi:hypothetical protein [Streptomyces inhibens]|uniref:hypothetical protein n=1 Tax=Streptomyces inhibens TaxID=2293571 RepID=UPI001EE6D93B|nr:hypothetical protein [Streptomyces inhibens]UKY47471.1 hypothetical protein KI385_00480 [Streptomyces inhibens]
MRDALEGERGGGGEDLTEAEEADADQAQGPHTVELSGGGDEQGDDAGCQQQSQSEVQQESGVASRFPLSVHEVRQLQPV